MFEVGILLYIYIKHNLLLLFLCSSLGTVVYKLVL